MSRAEISERTWSCSQSTAVNWVRWVTSWMATQSRKSRGSTSSRRSVSTMLGATSSSRPCCPSGWNASYCPSTLPLSQPSSVPIWTAETLAVTAADTRFCLASRVCCRGARTTSKPSALAARPPRPVDDGRRPDDAVQAGDVAYVLLGLLGEVAQHERRRRRPPRGSGTGRQGRAVLRRPRPGPCPRLPWRSPYAPVSGSRSRPGVAAIRSRAACAARVPVRGKPLAVAANASTVPSAVVTRPARALTPFSVPVLARTSPAALDVGGLR